MVSMEDIYKEYAELVYRYLLSLCGNADTAEELTQETFYQAVRSVDRYDGSSKVSTWLCAIAKNKWKESSRKAAREIPSSAARTAGKEAGSGSPAEDSLLEAALPKEKAAEDEVMTAMSSVEIHKAIHDLPEPSREVLYLRLLADLSFRQIGEIFGKSEEWARVTFYRGKLRLRKELGDEHDE